MCSLTSLQPTIKQLVLLAKDVKHLEVMTADFFIGGHNMDLLVCDADSNMAMLTYAPTGQHKESFSYCFLLISCLPSSLRSVVAVVGVAPCVTGLVFCWHGPSVLLFLSCMFRSFLFLVRPHDCLVLSLCVCV